ncbi:MULTISPECIES: LysR substrate-binding domain-containing protein [unclassified Sinorhizobium]|uniref:LysR substrate-binding domain-containing protein n=1 Tax=unclassified Sinorhizobium TaxID=2613772 RepID=UPI0024C436F8|nr:MULTISPECIES: LysR substrate-binding domain-containing protein [unclassified Sinorhizobium]MDK1378234.1 LysR substrate-binding domain-containing protein [Sinorhizobium sp. 6-70]MDK1480383.1 LysR substrate-binding domain-containing protein [Sinorhizobium sp. 6-117]
MLPPLGTLRVFEVAARLASFSRAADELHVTHAAVSHQIRQLEEWFGRPLFLREKRGVRLAPDAERLAEALSESFERIAAEAGSLKLRTRSEITVACIPSIATRWLIPALSEFLSTHADITVRVVYASAAQRLRETGCDVLVTLGADTSDGILCTRLFSRVNKPVASPRYIESKGDLMNVEQIAAADLLHDETTAHWQHWFTKAGVSSSGVPRGPVFQDFNLLATAAIAGHGVALCPVEVCRREITNGDLIVLSDIAVLEEESYFLISKASRQKAVAAFCGWFQDVVDPAAGHRHLRV